jgi:hypothetical protein
MAKSPIIDRTFRFYEMQYGTDRQADDFRRTPRMPATNMGFVYGLKGGFKYGT